MNTFFILIIYLKLIKIYLSLECFDKQPENTYCDINLECTSCTNKTCLTCSLDLAKCDTCKTNDYLFDNNCSSQKPVKGAFCDDNTKKCEKCSDQNCETCSSDKNVCTKCNSSFPYIYQNKCYSSKPANTSCDSNNVCTDTTCPLNCKTCDSKNICTQCNDPYLLLNVATPTCVEKSQIPKNFFCDLNNVCLQCSDECSSCKDNKDNCTGCNNTKEFLFNQKCYQDQPQNTYCNEKFLCQDCTNKQCKNCLSNLNGCQNCQENYYLFQENCYNQIPSGAFCDKNTKICQKCNIENCDNCQDDINSCTQCSNEFYLLNNGTPSCIIKSQVPNNFFCNNKRVCNQCNDTCATCIDDKDYCLTCKDPTNYLYTKAKSAQCLKDKPIEGFCQDKNCQDCITKNCQICPKNGGICEKCYQDRQYKYLYKNDCLVQAALPKNIFCDKNNVCQEKGNDTQQEKGCKKSEYTYDGQCLSKMPENAYCNSKTNECQKCTNLACYTCQSDLNTCIDCLEDSYFYENKCQDKKPKHVFCNKQEKLKVCQPCHELCSECSGSSELECDSCYPDAVLSKGKCIKSALEFNSSISQEQVIQIGNQAESTSQATSSSSTALSLSSNLVSRSSFGLVVSGLTSQKLTYMVLVDTDLPPVVFSVLTATKDQLPQNQMKFLNVFTRLINLSDDEVNQFVSIRFESVKLSYNILNNCGQGISIFVICYILFVLSYLLIEKSSIKKLSNFSSTLYSKLTCGMIVQYFQICLSIFVVGINSQILEFVNEKQYEMSGVKITLIILLIAIVIYIMYLLYKYLNTGQIQKGVQNFYEITREKILNETIFESKIRRNFILIYLIIDSIILPTIFLQFYFYPILVSSLAIFFQLLFLVIVCALMPFHSKITNGYFILTSALWVALYITYLLLNIYSSKSDIDNFASVLDNLTWVFYIIIQIILLSNPAYMVLMLLNKLVEFVNQKLSERKKKLLQNEQQLFNSFNENFNSVQYRPQISQAVLIDDVTSREIISPNQQIKNRHNWIKKLN
ncbi:transmembrane protein, putative (macronuclear) [Tetrahymena thermophila SB210]|uniref:Transmembrane protein, putative n=1 Tax=Tetrahymena thermophila (strain SB210) TaxID=312017 RepID=Q23AH6_TETTS|nr:transmembrane protein, putative [Tetrahymena thermophila SB210]EAR93516.2 transmembrane protein, putative [Tetrahymena thermophila SB210]|eukprot:XP_001013761.2 transmembrane protein, putative [Tetrahymena thermophila SB210]